MKTKEQKRKDALDRQTDRESRTPAAQIARLDRKFGVGQGAKKERARLTEESGAEVITPPKTAKAAVVAGILMSMVPTDALFGEAFGFRHE